MLPWTVRWPAVFWWNDEGGTYENTEGCPGGTAGHRGPPAWRRAGEAPDHGYGGHQRGGNLCFSINLLTLFALVLAIGTVVDDAIVVVEAVQAKFDEGYQSAYIYYIVLLKIEYRRGDQLLRVE